MKLYDFAKYAARRDARRQESAAAEAVAEAVACMEQPGSVVELKRRVDVWFSLHRAVLEQSKSA